MEFGECVLIPSRCLVDVCRARQVRIPLASLIYVSPDVIHFEVAGL